jgi:hypothetical protein
LFEALTAVALVALNPHLDISRHFSDRDKPNIAAVEEVLNRDVSPASGGPATKRLRISSLRCRAVPIKQLDPQGTRSTLEAVARCSYKISRADADGRNLQTAESAIFVYEKHACGEPGQEADMWCLYWSRDKYGS